jgi:predicted anti-sigma-YlaC factor YlaD
MTSRLLQRFLGTSARDAGCEAGFEVLDQYVDAVLRGEDAETLFPEVAAHLQNCDACREDTEGLMAALRNLSPS